LRALFFGAIIATVVHTLLLLMMLLLLLLLLLPPSGASRRYDRKLIKRGAVRGLSQGNLPFYWPSTYIFGDRPPTKIMFRRFVFKLVPAADKIRFSSLHPYGLFHPSKTSPMNRNLHHGTGDAHPTCASAGDPEARKWRTQKKTQKKQIGTRKQPQACIGCNNEYGSETTRPRRMPSVLLAAAAEISWYFLFGGQRPRK
jgi:hypothetical protein